MILLILLMQLTFLVKTVLFLLCVRRVKNYDIVEIISETTEPITQTLNIVQ